ncbi:MAG: glycosyltransferase [Candidatus Sericytochromatia bacterium]|nr:glycosyltransferase [Candidatus Tanganyikabacteria bacterium]
MTRVLVITHERIGPAMAGPGIRACELARQLHEACSVTLVTMLPLGAPVEAAFPVLSCYNDHHHLFRIAAEADVLVLQGLMLRRFPRLGQLGKRLVMDMYDPFVFEAYPQLDLTTAEGRAQLVELWDIQNEQMDQADFFICASERQRDMYLGHFCALGRLQPEISGRDPGFRSLIDVVPFGVQDVSPVHSGQPALRGVVPGIGNDDTILLWGGGIWDWFDPLTVIRAVAEVARMRSDVKLVFLGTKPPNPELAEMSMTARARALSDELGLTGSHVFFNEGWVPYSRRQDYLLESDVGISSHFDALETRFAFRTRVLDYFWAGLPVLTTEGDSMAEQVERLGLGRVLPYGSVEAWTGAILEMAEDRAERGDIRFRILAHREALRWSVVARPLVAYCLAPWMTPRPVWSVSGAYGHKFRPAWSRAWARVARAWREGGPRLLVRKSAGYVLPRLPVAK